jgi:hypothetical protein
VVSNVADEIATQNYGQRFAVAGSLDLHRITLTRFLETSIGFSSRLKTGAATSIIRDCKLIPCIQSWVLTNHQKRVAVLHGPDLVLESSVKPSCFPEREVVFVTEVGRGIMPHPITAKIRMWVTKNHDVTHIRIVDSSASSREQEMVAVGFVTNHKCTDRMSKNCSVRGGAAFVPID